MREEEGLFRQRPIYFVGAGPGDPELLTIRASKLISQADLIIYTGSLVPKNVLNGTGAKVLDSSSMTLEEVMDEMLKGYEEGKLVIRLHTGDPSIYSAIGEQIAILKQKGISYKVIPGVTAGLAASCSLGKELTIPGISQTVIISRIAGRTPVPERESLPRLARIGASLILYLSVSYIKEVINQLSEGYSLDTPVAVVEKATWPDERIITGTLKDIADKVQRAGIKKTAVIIVGQALEGVKDLNEHHSLLYHRNFCHGFRKALFEKQHILKKFFSTKSKKKSCLIIYLGKKGRKLAEHLLRVPGFSDSQIESFSKLKKERLLPKYWEDVQCIIFISSVAVAVRTIAPLITDKYSDPAVLSIDESGKNVVCLLSGHLGGGNELTRKIGSFLNAVPVITTQSDVEGLPPLDLWLRKQNLVPNSLSGLKRVQAIFRDKAALKVYIHELLNVKALPKGLYQTDEPLKAQLLISPFTNYESEGLLAIPRCLSLGVGCHRGMEPKILAERLLHFLKENNLSYLAISKVCTIDKKASENAIVFLAKELGAELLTFSPDQLDAVDEIQGSKTVKSAVGAKAVSEPAALLGAGDEGKILVKKTKYPDCTFAIGLIKFTLDPFWEE